MWVNREQGEESQAVSLKREARKQDNVEPQRLVVKKSGFYLEYNEK